MQNQGYAAQVGGINQANANALTAQNNQFNQGQTLGRNLGAGIQGVGNWWQNRPSSGFPGATSFDPMGSFR